MLTSENKPSYPIVSIYILATMFNELSEQNILQNKQPN